GDEGRAPRGEGPGAGTPPVHPLCLTASDDPNQVFFMPPRHRQRADGPPPCTLTYLSQTDASANWSLSCDGPRGVMQAQAQAQFSADHYSASLSFASETRGPEHGRMVTASRLGDCSAAPAITDQE
ncbi:MAG TPA: DUF3617 family protein, partial [Marinagarivorans sp.]|nr:DUF3617 family protein [Marinagarivorans sp.]